MTKQEFLLAMDNLLELPEHTLSGPEKLDDMENWNSMAMIEYIALADTHSGLKLSPRQIRDCNSIDDLGRLAGIG
jgi:acyl carrier protein